MQFSVEVKRLKKDAVFICRGYLQEGDSSDYLFDLVTRPDRGDVVIDAAHLTVEKSGVAVLAVCSQFLRSSRRRLLIENAHEFLLEDLRANHVIIPAVSAGRPNIIAKAVNGSSQ